MRKLFPVLITLFSFFCANAQTVSGGKSLCGGSSDVLTVTGITAGDTYNWQSSSDGTNWTDISGTLKQSTYTAITAAYYRVVVTSSSNKTSNSFQVINSTKPGVTFIIDNDNTCSGTPIKFTSTVTPGTPPYSYAWTFGDGTTSNLASPTHAFTYLGCGTKTISNSLTVTDANGCDATVSNSMKILEKPDIQLADIDIFYPFSNCHNSPTAANPNYTITVNNASANSSCITSYSVDWGDGNVQTGLTNGSFPLTHTYTILGAFNLIFTGAGANGCSNKISYVVANQSNPAGGLGTLGSTTNLCAPAEIPFVISNWENNSPGTIYVLDFGDGNSVTLSHPLKTIAGADTIKHTYTKSSCPAKSFTATLTAINACDSTPYTAGNIQINIKPQADFTTQQTACVNQSVCFTNTTIKGYSGTNCSDLTVNKWNFGDAGSTSNTSTSESPCHTYTAPGNYTITLETSNPCGSSTATQQVCVLPVPVPSFTLDKTTGCGPLSVAATNTSNTLTGCAASAYKWTVSYNAGGCGTTSSYDFTNGTNESSVDPSFIFTNAGTYTIQLAVTNPCGTYTTSKTVTITQPPIVSISSVSDVCGTASISPTVTVSGCNSASLSYQWLFPGGSPSSSTSANPGTVVYSSSGNYTITLQVTNDCGTTTATKSFSVNAVPVITVPTSVAYCAGVTTGTFGFSSNPVATVTWTNDNTTIGLTSSGTGNISPFTTSNNTSSTQVSNITASATTNGCTGSSSFSITVYPKPNAPVVTSPVNYCIGQTATPLTAMASGSNTLLWYTTGSGGTPLPVAPTPSTATAGTTMYYVSQLSTVGNCESPRSEIDVIVRPTPSFTATATDPTQCGAADGSLQLKSLAPSTTYTIAYTQDGVNKTTTLTSDAGGNITINNLPAGIYDHIVVTSFGCPSAEGGPFTLKSPNPPATPVLTTNAPVCSGKTLELHATTTTAGVPTWSWSGPNNFSSSLSDPTIPNVQVAETGTYHATVTISNCTSAAGDITVVINPTPVTPTVTSNSPVCSGNTITFNNTPGGNGITYTWSGPNGFSSTDQNPSIPNATTAMSGEYKVIATLGNCPSAEGATTVVVNQTPVISSGTSRDPTECASQTGSITLKGLAASQAYTVSYTKNGSPVSRTLLSDVGGNLIISDLTAGTYGSIQVSINGCLSNTVGPFTLADPTPPTTPVITGGAVLCSGNAVTLSIGEVSGATYAWTGPGGYVNTTPQITIPNAAVSNSGTYNVTITVAGCTSQPATKDVVVNPTPVVTAGSNSPVCSGTNIQLAATTSFAGNLTWQWSGPNGYSSPEQNPVIPNAAANTTPDTYSVTATATTGNCPSKPSSVQVIVHPTPGILSTIKTDPSACATPTGSITLHTSLPNTSFVVHYTYKGNAATVTLPADGNGDVTINALPAGIYDHIYVEAAGCSSPETGAITLSDPSPPAAPTVSSNSPLCAGSTLNLQATPVPGVTGTYVWNGPNNFSSTNQNPVIPNVQANNNGTYNVTITVNNCTSPAGTTNVIVNPLAAAPAAPSPVEYCVNTTAVSLTATATNGGSLSWYEVVNGGTELPSAPTPSTATAGSVFYYVSQTSMAGCEGARTPVEVVTHPDAKALFSPPQTLGCSPFVITNSIVNLQPYPNNNGNYQWYASDVLIGSSATFPGYTIAKDGDSVTIQLKALSLFGCKDDSTAQKFFTYQLPKTAFTSSSTGGCGPLNISFINKTPQASLFKFKWIFGNGQTSGEENPPAVTFATNPTYGDTTYHVTLLGYTVCDTITATTDILIKSKPKSLFAPDKTSGCSPFTVHFANISKGVGTTYQWFFGDGAGTTTNEASAVEHIYNTGIQDTFYAKLVATNECGTDTSTFAIVVSPNKVKLNIAINGNQSTGCAPHLVQFINRSSGASNFAWNFGDGNTLNTTKNIDTVTHIYTKSGTFTTNLFASNGCSDTTTTETATVFDKPVSGFGATPLSLCIGDTVSFQNDATGYSSLSWQFGDNTGSVLTDPKHAYTTAGNYTATQVAQKQYGNGTVCADTTKTAIIVVDKLPGNFTASATGGTCVPFTVTFTNHSLPSALTTWTFSDGTTATGDVVTHTFITPGTYTIAMQAKHPAGCLYEATNNLSVQAPSGTVSYAPGFVCNNTPVRFESNTTNTDSVRWDFGDGTALTTKERVVYHVFDKPGTFTPAAELISGGGCRVPAATNEIIKVDYLQAGFAQQQDIICGKTTVHFNDTSRAFFGISSWHWNLGDGTETSQQNPVRDYTASGTLPIQLVTTGNSGCADTATLSLPVKVNDIPVAGITGPGAVCDGSPTSYTGSVSAIDAVSSYQWTITGGASYSTNSIVHTFPAAGNYTLQFAAGTSYGCYDTVVKMVTVSTTPAVTAGNDATICRGAATALSVSGTASQYNWQTEPTLSCTACANPLAAPLTTTQYRITGTSANGCSRTDSVLVTVVQPFTLNVSANSNICIGQSRQLTVSGAYEYSWSPAGTLDDSASQHPVATPVASTTYSVTGTDDHHCFTDTKTIVVGVGQYPTVHLGKDTLLSTGTIYPLHAEITEGPIATYTWLPAENLSCSTCAVPDANVKRNVCYSVTATNEYSCAGRDTVCIKVFCESGQVFIPNLFTPDNDGINDKLVVQGKGVALIRSFRIFNRWGQVVFEKTGFAPNDTASGWDGMVNGKPASPDVFVYTCEVVCDDGTVYPLKGNVAIVK